jgi:hypothetical protein
MLSGLRLYGAIAGGLLLLSVIAGAVWLIRENDRLSAVERRAQACEAAVKSASVLDSGTLLLNCPQSIADAATQADRYRQCDSALKVGELYAVRATCSEFVKRRDAEATALAATVADLGRQLSDARGQLAGALNRAAARAATASRKDAHAAAALSRAAPGADGRITCDDQCLRALTGN